MKNEMKNDIAYHNFVNNGNIAFEIIKTQNKTIKTLTISLIGIILSIILGVIYLFSNYDVSFSTTTTTENVDVGGDFNQFNDDATNNIIGS